MKSNCNNIIVVFLLVLGFIAAPARAKSVNNAKSSIMIIPRGVAKSGLLWDASSEIEFNKRVYGRYGIYTDEASDIVVNWFKSCSVDKWLRPSYSDIFQMTSSVSRDKIELRWTRDCYSPPLRCFNLSLRRISHQDGKKYWLAIMLEDRNGSFDEINSINRAFDGALKTQQLRIKSISSKSLFVEHNNRFKFKSVPRTLEDAIKIVQEQLSESDNKILLDKSWIDQYNVSLRLGILQDIENDFDIDGACNPLSHIIRKSDGALMHESWVSAFILKGAIARNKGEIFDIESELNEVGLVPKNKH